MKAGLYALRENEARSVTMEHFFRAVKEAIIPSVTDEMEREYEKLARKVEQEAMRIGFGRGD